MRHQLSPLAARLGLGLGLLLLGVTTLNCSRTPPTGDPSAKADAAAGADGASTGASGPGAGSAAGSGAANAAGGAPAVVVAMPTPANALPCRAANGPTCFRFVSTEDAFRFVLGRDPLVLAIGEAHAQKGTESIASSTKRFTDTLLPIAAPKSSDVVVELWAPDPKCMKEVKQVASAQKPVTDVQASTNQNEYVTLGNKAKAAGMTPWLLRPTCDDFSMLADAGADAIGASLGLIKRLTQQKVTQLYDRNRSDAGPPATASKVVIAYGGALHNDLAPSEAMKEFSFGPELDRMTNGRYIELDLIVPEFVKKTPTWEKLPWFASFEADHADNKSIEKATLYVLGERSFVLVFPNS